MFFESIGKLFFSKRRAFFFFLFLLTPLFITSIFLFFESKNLSLLEDRIDYGLRKKALSQKVREQNAYFFSKYSQTDPYFLDNHVENASFLKREKSHLQSLLLHKAFSNSKELTLRLDQLENNRLRFMEKNTDSYGNIRDTKEALKNPVQMEEEELLSLLSLIEGTKPFPSRPQLLLENLTIERAQSPFLKEVLEVDMNLIKREFIP